MMTIMTPGRRLSIAAVASAAALAGAAGGHAVLDHQSSAASPVAPAPVSHVLGANAHDGDVRFPLVAAQRLGWLGAAGAAIAAAFLFFPKTARRAASVVATSGQMAIKGVGLAARGVVSGGRALWRLSRLGLPGALAATGAAVLGYGALQGAVGTTSAAGVLLIALAVTVVVTRYVRAARARTRAGTHARSHA